MTDAASLSDASRILLAVNGGLMRGLKANDRMVEVGATFVREAATKAEYRLWSVDDDYPAMMRDADGSGNSIAVEIWSLHPITLLETYEGEPGGLMLGWVNLDDGTRVLGVLGEAAVVEGQREITRFGGWRSYTQAEGILG